MKFIGYKEECLGGEGNIDVILKECGKYGIVNDYIKGFVWFIVRCV